jgi:maleate cis-trans isomerase
MDTPQAKTHLVGVIKPTSRPETMADTDLVEHLPAAIRIESTRLNFTRGTADEFTAAMPAYEEKISEFARQGAELVLPSGAPPFMLLGYDGEAKLVDSWEKKHKTQVFTSGQNHVRALKALGIKRFVGASYFPDKLNQTFATYFKQAGFEALSMEGIGVPFLDVPKFPPEKILAQIKRQAKESPTADGVYMLGSAWRTLDIIAQIERETGLPVVHPVPARFWEIQIRLGFRQRLEGYGRLLTDMPN